MDNNFQFYLTFQFSTGLMGKSSNIVFIKFMVNYKQSLDSCGFVIYC